jgi:hypothetical protein
MTDSMTWEQAAALAQTVSPAPVSKRSDGLPYLFQSATSRGILVHRGQIVTVRGVAVAGAYLRDLGIIDQRGPGLDDVLHLLTVLEALPKIDGLVGDEYIHCPGDERLGELTARLEADGSSAREARVVLCYFLDLIPGPSAILSGERLASMVPPRPIARAVLTIPREGDASWTISELAWRDPAE